MKITVKCMKFAIANILLLPFIFNVGLLHAEDKFKIGILVPLSGLASEYGLAIKNGITLSLEDHKKSVNACEFIYEDSEYSSTKSVSAFHALVGQGINLVYAFGGPMSEVIAPLAESKKVPFICDGNEPRVTADKNFVIRHASSGLELGTAISKYLGFMKKRRIAIVRTQNQYLNSLLAGFKESSEGKFEVLDVIDVVAGDSDFKPILPRLLKGKYDSIGLFLLPGQLSSLAKLFKGRSEQYTFFSTTVVESKNEVTASLGVLEGAVYPNNFVSPQFRERYISRFQNDSQIKFAGEGYDVVSLIINSICSRGTIPNGEESMHLLKSVKVREGVLGRTEYVETDAGDKYFKAPVYVMRASVDGFRPVE